MAVLNPKAWWTYYRSRRPNFHVVVAGHMLRSATPTPEDLERYKTYYGLKTWVDLRMPKDYTKDGRTVFFDAQCAAASRLEIKRISFPLDDFGVVSDEQVQTALALMGDSTKWPMLWACRGGRHRAGLMIALFRLRFMQWAGARAYDEAKDTGGYYASGHKTFDKRFKQLMGMILALPLMAVPAFGQSHPYLKPDPALKALTVENIVHMPNGSYSIGPCIDTRTRAEKIAAGCIVEMGNGMEYHCAVGHGCLVVATDKDSLQVAPAKFDRSFWLASSLWLGGSAADLTTTKFALDRGGIERNPIHARDGGHKLRWSTAIAATAGTWAFAAYCERKGHRRIARAVLITGAIVRTGLAFWNNTRSR